MSTKPFMWARAIGAGITLLTALAAPAAASEWQTIHPGGETACATGTPFNFHVRPAAADRLLLFFNGGGACWSAETCDVDGAPGSEPTYRPFATAEAGNDPRTYGGAFALDRPENPFRDWSQVFVSYCTGDVHLGNADSEYRRADGSTFTIRHRGRVNALAALEYVFERFGEPDRIVVAGGSAGAVASPVYAALVAERYPDAEVVQFAGGAGGYRLPPPTRLWQTWGTFRDFPALFPRRYGEANTTLIDLYRMAAEVAPEIAFHQYDTAYDAVQEQFHALLGVPVELLEGLDANRRELAAELPRFRSYTAAGEFHTLLRYDELYTVRTGAVRVLDWVRALAEGQEVADVHCGTAATCR